MTGVAPIVPSHEGWSPKELMSDSSWQVKLTSADADELKSALVRYKLTHPAINGKFAVPLDSEQFPLPGLEALLARVQHDLEYGRGVFLLENFPLDCSEEDSRLMFGGLLAHVGWLQPQTIRGEYLQPVQDEGQARLHERRGSKHNLGLPVHNDGCDVVGFLCRRRAAIGGDTILVSAASVHDQMLNERPDALLELYGNFHNAWQDYMFPDGLNIEGTGRSRTWEAPIFSMTERKLCVRYSRFYIDRAQGYTEVPQLTPVKLAALDAFDEYLYNAEQWQYRRQFEPGDVLLVNNHIVFHTRTAFEDGLEQHQKRQLYRAWMAMPNSRPISPELADFFGNFAAGSRRRCCVKDEFMLKRSSN